MTHRWFTLALAVLLPLGFALQGAGATPPKTASVATTPTRAAPTKSPKKQTGKKTLDLLFTGDVSMTWRALPAKLKRLGWKQNPLRYFADTFKAADLSVSNFEGVLSNGDPKYAEPRLNLWAPVASGRAFADANVQLVSNANNHAFDGRDAGVLRTLTALRKSGVKVFGIGRTVAQAKAPYVFKKHGACVAILPGTTKSNKGVRGRARLAYYPWIEWSKMVEAVRHTVKNVCPFVVVYLHWGTEKIHYPRRKIKAFGRKIIEAGATLLVGHHPHVLQGVEYHKGGAIVYSLGNFVFSNPNKSTRRTGILKVRLTTEAGKPARLSRLELIPAHIHRKDYTPRPANRPQQEDLLRRMRQYCKPFGTQVVMHDGRIRFLSAGDVLPPKVTDTVP